MNRRPRVKFDSELLSQSAPTIWMKKAKSRRKRRMEERYRVSEAVTGTIFPRQRMIFLKGAALRCSIDR